MTTKKNEKNLAQELTQESELEGDGTMSTIPEKSQTINNKNDAQSKTDTEPLMATINNKNKGRGNTKTQDIIVGGDWPIIREQIEIVRESKARFIVFLDSNQDVRWLANIPEAQPLSSDARSAISKIRLLAATPVIYLTNAQKRSWNRMIGESLALALSGDVENANSTTRKAHNFILARAKETARIWFIEGSFIAFLPMLLLGIALYFNMDNHGIALWFHIPLAQAIVFGSIGAQFSMLLRISQLNVDPGAGRKAHYGEAFIRIFLGVFSAVIAVIAVQSDLIFGFIEHATSSTKPDAKLWWIPAIAVLAGASERLIPTFLHQIESNALANGLNASEAGNNPRQENNIDDTNEVKKTNQVSSPVTTKEVNEKRA